MARLYRFLLRAIIAFAAANAVAALLVSPFTWCSLPAFDPEEILGCLRAFGRFNAYGLQYFLDKLLLVYAVSLAVTFIPAAILLGLSWKGGWAAPRLYAITGCMVGPALLTAYLHSASNSVLQLLAQPVIVFLYVLLVAIGALAGSVFWLIMRPREKPRSH